MGRWARQPLVESLLSAAACLPLQPTCATVAGGTMVAVCTVLLGVHVLPQIKLELCFRLLCSPDC
jgi:hypothetical protein